MLDIVGNLFQHVIRPAFRLLNHQLVADENHPNKMDVAALTERMRGFLAGDYTAILFEQDDVVVAYALYHPFEDNEIYFRQFFVVRERRREGLGRQAVQLLVEEVFPSNKRIILTALSGNERALAFWGDSADDCGVSA